MTLYTCPKPYLIEMRELWDEHTGKAQPFPKTYDSVAAVLAVVLLAGELVVAKG